MPSPLPPINLERIQTVTRDLATLLGISLPEPAKQKTNEKLSTYEPQVGKQDGNKQRGKISRLFLCVFFQ